VILPEPSWHFAPLGNSRKPKFVVPTSVGLLYVVPTSVGLLYVVPTSVGLLYVVPTLVGLLYVVPTSVGLLYVVPTLVGLLVFGKPDRENSRTPLKWELHTSLHRSYVFSRAAFPTTWHSASTASAAWKSEIENRPFRELWVLPTAAPIAAVRAQPRWSAGGPPVFSNSVGERIVAARERTGSEQRLEQRRAAGTPFFKHPQGWPYPRCPKGAENRKPKIGCASFGDKFWEGVKLLWFEQAAVVLLCEDCLVEPRKSKETREEFDDSAVLPGHMEMALAMV